MVLFSQLCTIVKRYLHIFIIMRPILRCVRPFADPQMGRHLQIADPSADEIE